ncbi:MAG: hypothetical protein ACLR7Y_15215 [Dysosmobacter sp.]
MNADDFVGGHSIKLALLQAGELYRAYGRFRMDREGKLADIDEESTRSTTRPWRHSF